VATNQMLSLLSKFVEKNSNFVDIQWDQRMSPKLLFNPYSEFYEDKRKAAHYFLLASSVLEEGVVGYSENARRLLVYSKFKSPTCLERRLLNADFMMLWVLIKKLYLKF
jgi:hypothetical protein